MSKDGADGMPVVLKTSGSVRGAASAREATHLRLGNGVLIPLGDERSAAGLSPTGGERECGAHPSSSSPSRR